MQYFVKRGYTYVNPATGHLTQAGCEVAEPTDPSQRWKLVKVKPGELVQQPEPKKIVKKQMTFDEATKAAVERRDEITKARREARSEEQVAEVEAAKVEAAAVDSNSVKTKKPIEPDDYIIDPLDEGEET